jgi:hypothetical protein
MKTVWNLLVALALVAAWLLASALDHRAEAAKKRALGAHYEGPLDE